MTQGSLPANAHSVYDCSVCRTSEVVKVVNMEVFMSAESFVLACLTDCSLSSAAITAARQFAVGKNKSKDTPKP